MTRKKVFPPPFLSFLRSRNYRQLSAAAVDIILKLRQTRADDSFRSFFIAALLFPGNPHFTVRRH